MTIDASAVARVLGIETVFKDLRGGAIQFLPQRIALFAQGATAITYSTAKWQATSAAAAGARYGFGSPIHLCLRELMPATGDGVGTIPVTVYPLTDAASSTVATGDITPSGTATAASSWRIRVGGVLSDAFTIPIGAVNVNNTLRAMQNALGPLEMPVTFTHTYGSVTASALVGTGNGTITVLSASGAPKPGAYTLTVNTVVANGGVWTLTDPDGTVVSTTVTMTPGVGGATVIVVGGLTFTLTDGTTDFGLGATFTITVPATKTNLISKWKGISANDLIIEMIGDTTLGVTFALTQPTGGLINPSVSAAIALVGTVWESLVLNALNIEETTALDAFQTFGEGRWGELVRMPLVVFTGNNETTLANATAITSTRRTDRINAQLVSPGSVNLPCVIAARQLARIAVVANNNPPTDYGSQRATGQLPGADGVQWDYATRDLAVKAGSSTIEVKDSVVNLSDIVTFYRPIGEDPPAYRYVVDIVKLQNVVYNLALRFATADWDGAPLIPDDQPTVNPRARKPKSAKALAADLIDNLGLQAIISDPKSAKASIIASINGSNPKRLDMTFTVKLSGNTNIKGIQLNFGFYFGAQTLVA